jgi:D-3-phosphoglycerate dehydrogenase
VTTSPPTAPPRVFVGPQAPPEILRAVTSGGCAVTDEPRRADAVVWVGKDVEALSACLHDGVSWVQLPDAGIERWLAAGLCDRRYVLTSARGVYGPQVAEHALALILACTRHLADCARASSWSPEAVSGVTLRDSVVAVIGAGGIGAALIPMLKPLGCRTIAVTRHGRPVPGADTSLPETGLDTALSSADVIVLAAPSTPQTVGLIDARRLTMVKPSAFLINVARGNLVDTPALLAALDDGRLAGAALDVVDPEPLPDQHPLWRHPRVLITPHTANPAPVKLASFADRVAENCCRFAAGEPLLGVVQAQLGY